MFVLCTSLGKQTPNKFIDFVKFASVHSKFSCFTSSFRIHFVDNIFSDVAYKTFIPLSNLMLKPIYGLKSYKFVILVSEYLTWGQMGNWRTNFIS